MVKPCSFSVRMVLPICWMMTGARPSVGSSSSNSRAPVRRMRPIASICCSPPDSLVPWLAPSRSLQIGKQFEDALERKPARPDHRRQQQIFLDIEAGEDAALLRAERDAGARDLIRRAIDQFLALEAHRAGAPPDHAHDRLQRRGLAGAVAAEQRHHLAFVHVEARAVQDVRLAVPGLQVLDREQGRARVKHAPLPCRLRALPDCWRPSA